MASAQPLDVEALARQPGTTVTTRTENGRTVTELSRAGVVITISPDGVISMDTKDRAVWCLWEIAVGAKITTDVCHPGEFPQLSKVLGDFIDAANAFIIANSPRPVTLAQLEQAIAERRAQGACHRPLVLLINADVEKTRRDLMDSLKVPRWPASNPCL